MADRLVRLPGKGTCWIDPSIIVRVQTFTVEGGTSSVVMSTTEGFSFEVHPTEDQSVSQLAAEIMAVIGGPS